MSLFAPDQTCAGALKPTLPESIASTSRSAFIASCRFSALYNRDKAQSPLCLAPMKGHGSQGTERFALRPRAALSFFEARLVSDPIGFGRMHLPTAQTCFGEHGLIAMEKPVARCVCRDDLLHLIVDHFTLRRAKEVWPLTRKASIAGFAASAFDPPSLERRNPRIDPGSPCCSITQARWNMSPSPASITSLLVPDSPNACLCRNANLAQEGLRDFSGRRQGCLR